MAISATAALITTSTTALTTGFAGAGLLSTFGGTFLVDFALGSALGALSKSSSGANGGGYEVNTRGSALDHQIIYGETKVGGVVVFEESTGTENKYFHKVIALAGHQIDGHSSFFLGDEKLTFDSNGNVIAPEHYNGKVRIRIKYGAEDQIAVPELVAESSSWTSQHRLRGIAYVYMRLVFDADSFPNGVPNLSVIIRGKKVYDPRTGQTNWSNNAALITRDYLVSSYGLNEEPANIDDELVKREANLCDQIDSFTGQKKFTCNGTFTTALSPYDVIPRLLSSMGGKLWYAQGKWRMKSASWSNPVQRFDEDDLRSSVSVSTRHSRRDNFNTVKGKFSGEETNWQATDYPEVSVQTFIDTDGGQQSVADLDLPFTNNSEEARRVARVYLEGNRQQLSVSTTFGVRGLKIQVGDNIYFNNKRFGWVDKLFEVTYWNLINNDDNTITVEVSLKETSPRVFDEVNDGVVFERDNTKLLSPFEVPEVDISYQADTKVIREKLVNVITLDITSPLAPQVDYTEVEYKLSSSPSWVSLGSGQLGLFEVVDLEDGYYDVRARAVNSFGIKGKWSGQQNILASGLLFPPSDVENFSAEVHGATLTLDWDAVPDLDLSYYKIRYSPVGAVNPSWSNSTTYVDKVPRPASSVSVPAKAGTYFVRAFDKSGSASAGVASVFVSAGSIEPFNTTLTNTMEPTFSGTKSNTEVVSSELRLDNYSTANSEGEYSLSGYLDAGSKRACKVHFDCDTVRFASGASTFDDVSGNFDDTTGDFDDAGSLGLFSDTNVTFYVSTTDDNPAGSPTWSAYEKLRVTTLDNRAYRFKVKLTSSTVNVTPSIVKLNAYVEYN